MPSASSLSILVVEDDADTAELLKLYLEDAGYKVRVAARGDEGLALARESEPDAILLDLMLPGMSGWTFCEQLRRESDVPILMITARTQESDRLHGFELGIDDYISKPFSPREVAMRVRAVLRRTQGEPEPASLRFAELGLDLGRRSLHVGQQEASLTATEFEILRVLMTAPERVFSREQLVQHMGRDFHGQIRTVDAHVGNLRRKLAGTRSCSIQTVIGVGYRLIPGQDEN